MPYEPIKNPGRPADVGPSDPPTKGYLVVPAAADLPVYARALWIGVAGTISFVPLRQADDTPISTTVGQGVFPWAVRRVLAAGTTASQILAMHD